MTRPLTIFQCRDPEVILHEMMAAKNDEEERQMDLALVPVPPVVLEPEVICAAIVEEWTAYG